MTWFERLLGRTPAGVPASGPPPSDAREWLAATSGQDCIWRDLGDLELPGRRMFVGGPTGSHDDHLRGAARRGAATVEVDRLRVWVFEAGAELPAFEAHRNTLVWLEAHRTRPATRRRSVDFGVDAACSAIGNMAAGDAFARFSDHEYEAGRGDSFDWIEPFIQEYPHFARWVEIPPEGHRMFITSTGDDGGFAAVWLHDERDALSGVLIDIGGRSDDAAFLDTPLPRRDVEGCG